MYIDTLSRRMIAILFAAFFCMCFQAEIEAQNLGKNRREVVYNNRGYYKDVFMNSGIGLTSRRRIPATDYLGLQMELFVGPRKDATEEDKAAQTAVFCGSEEDTNGRLLYPDGAPRYRVIYCNGGGSGGHSASQGEAGRERLREYFRNGGSYVGTCAGSSFATAGRVEPNKITCEDIYLGLYPGYLVGSGVRGTSIAMTIAPRSPLLRFFDFGKDKSIDPVKHNGGHYAYDGKLRKMPKGTEIMTLYKFEDTDKVKINKKPAVWAYKPNDTTGRVINCGSHPEGAKSGEPLELMSAMLLYAMEGNPAPRVKGLLKSGEIREMNKHTTDNNPAYTRVGDRQYHHFEVRVPSGCKQLKITLEGYKNENKYDLTLCADRGTLAFQDSAPYRANYKGCDKQMTIENPKKGKWYISVFCETTVTTNNNEYGTIYTGNIGVLNGVPYKISVEY